jgi:hypothetical protein
MTWEPTILAAVRRCPGLTINGIAAETGASKSATYFALRVLEYSGQVKRTDDWPAGWVPVEPNLEQEVADLTAIEGLLREAMQLPEWQQAPAAVRRKVELAHKLARGGHEAAVVEPANAVDQADWRNASSGAGVE